jgi:hypothetical protein
MAFFIFQKSLRSLEKFRKKHHIKIPPKSLCTNFQSLGIFKNLIFILKINSLQFRPSRPTGLFILFGPRGPPLAFLPPPAEPMPLSSQSHAATPSPPRPPFLPALVLPLLLYSLAVMPPLAIEATASLTVTPPSQPWHPSPSPIKGPHEHTILHRTSPHTSSPRPSAATAASSPPSPGC